ncbi:MFS transporter [Paraglaciecola sp. Hal342]
MISIGMILGAILGGKYAQKFDFMSLFAVLLVCVLLLLLAISFVQHWFWLLIGALVLGMFASSLFTIGHTVIARLHVERRSAMMGFMDFMFSLGTLAAPFFVSGLYLIEHDWRWPLRILAAGMLILAVYTWRVAHQGKKLVAPEEAKKNRKVFLMATLFAVQCLYFWPSLPLVTAWWSLVTPIGLSVTHKMDTALAASSRA